MCQGSQPYQGQTSMGNPVSTNMQTLASSYAAPVADVSQGVIPAPILPSGSSTNPNTATASTISGGGGGGGSTTSGSTSLASMYQLLQALMNQAPAGL